MRRGPRSCLSCPRDRVRSPICSISTSVVNGATASWWLGRFGRSWVTQLAHIWPRANAGQGVAHVDRDASTGLYFEHIAVTVFEVLAGLRLAAVWVSRSASPSPSIA